MGELRAVELAAEHAQKAELAFEHARRAGKTLAREIRRQHAALGRPPEVEALHHGAGASAGEFQQSAGERARNHEGVSHVLGIESHQPSARNRAAEWAGGTGRVEAAALVAVLRRAPDADHHLGTGDDGGDQRAAADAALLGDRKAGRQQRCAGMHAGARPGQIVHLEGMRERAVGQRCRRRVHPRRARPKNSAVATSAVLRRKRDDHAAPGQIVAEDDRGDGVGDALLGAFDDVRRDVLVTTGRRVVGQLRCLFRHCDIA